VSPCIFIVDDHDLIRKLVRDFLESEDEFSVCGEAIDGYDAIDKAQELKPDLIILDLAMPRMNGIHAASKLKGVHTPIILLTSHLAALDKFSMRAAGIDAVVTKGTEMSVLSKSVRDLLREARLASASVVRPTL
jgi:DNA-binding NarL/FixJ family response regulator